MVDASGSTAHWAEGAGSSSPSPTGSRTEQPSRDEARDARDARAHVLIVEDNDIVSGALRILFEETGRRVSTAGTIAEAVACATADPPDLVLLDVTLPDGDGLTVVERLRDSGQALGVVVALTGHDEPAIAERCSRLGCADVLLKPVPTRELLRKTGIWLGEADG